MKDNYDFVNSIEFRSSKLAILTILLLSTVYIFLLITLLTNTEDTPLEKSIFAIFLIIFPFMIYSASRFWLIGVKFNLNEEIFKTHFLSENNKIHPLNIKDIKKFVEKDSSQNMDLGFKWKRMRILVNSSS